jgi:hypothetical protein
MVMEINIANVAVVIGIFTVMGFIFKYLDGKIGKLRVEMSNMKGNYISRFEAVQAGLVENKIEIIKEIADMRMDFVNLLQDMKDEVINSRTA